MQKVAIGVLNLMENDAKGLWSGKSARWVLKQRNVPKNCKQNTTVCLQYILCIKRQNEVVSKIHRYGFGLKTACLAIVNMLFTMAKRAVYEA